MGGGSSHKNQFTSAALRGREIARFVPAHWRRHSPLRRLLRWYAPRISGAPISNCAGPNGDRPRVTGARRFLNGCRCNSGTRSNYDRAERFSAFVGSMNNTRRKRFSSCVFPKTLFTANQTNHATKLAGGFKTPGLFSLSVRARQRSPNVSSQQFQNHRSVVQSNNSTRSRSCSFVQPENFCRNTCQQ